MGFAARDLVAGALAVYAAPAAGIGAVAAGMGGSKTAQAQSDAKRATADTQSEIKGAAGTLRQAAVDKIAIDQSNAANKALSAAQRKALAYGAQPAAGTILTGQAGALGAQGTPPLANKTILGA